MKALIQRVKKASVTINGEIYSSIGAGMLIFLGVEKTDTIQNAEKLAQKVLNLRIFEDENEKMNLSLKDVNGELLIVSQFTLYGDAKEGNRPSFIEAELPDKANELYEYFMEKCKENGIEKVEHGVFGAHMDVSLTNDGPVTILIEK